MKLLITGSRKYDNYEKMKQVIKHLETTSKIKITMLLHGRKSKKLPPRLIKRLLELKRNYSNYETKGRVPSHSNRD